MKGQGENPLYTIWHLGTDTQQRSGSCESHIIPCVQVAGTSTKSGDNDALKALLDDERQHGRHVGIAPQCAFNSYVWRSRIRDWWRLVYMPNTILLGLHRPGPQLQSNLLLYAMELFIEFAGTS